MVSRSQASFGQTKKERDRYSSAMPVSVCFRWKNSEGERKFDPDVNVQVVPFTLKTTQKHSKSSISLPPIINSTMNPFESSLPWQTV